MSRDRKEWQADNEAGKIKKKKKRLEKERVRVADIKNESERAAMAVRKQKMIRENGYGAESKMREEVMRYWKP